MGITLYTAPDCIRCKIVKSFLAERGQTWDTVDFKADAKDFNAFYRATPAMWEIDYSWEGFRWLVADDNLNSVVAFERTDKAGEK